MEVEEDCDAAQRDAIAEKMRRGDYTGARTLLLETLQTNPTLDNAFEMLSVLEVLCVPGRPLQGLGTGTVEAVDWYRVLQVLPGDAAAKVEAQYRSIMVNLELVKDGLPGAELAIRLVDDAYAVLLDPAKRANFDSSNTLDSIKQKGMSSSSNALVGLRSEDISLMKGTHVACTALLSGIKRSIPSNANPQVDRLNITDTNYMHDNDRQSFEIGNCSNIASSSRSKRTNPCILGDDDDELQLPEHEAYHVDKKQKSVCEEDVHCVSSSMVDLNGCLADTSDDKQDENCSSKQYDYHNFEDDRSIDNFAVGQVWAAYDWEKFPRRYARICRILTDRRQLYVSWFKPYPQSHDDKNWLTASLPFVCGTFIPEERQISLTCPTMFCYEISNDNLNQHLVVYPKEGEVWAIYSDWDIRWCSNPEMRKKSVFSVVEIRTSYSKDSGCAVAHLVKVDGFRSVFQRYLRSGKEHLLQVQSDSLLMFSHRIPSFRFNHEIGTLLELEHCTLPENLQHENKLASAALSPQLPGLHSDTNGFHEAAVSQSSNPSTSKMGSGTPHQGMMNYNNKLSPEDFLEGQIWAVYDVRDRMPRSYVRIIRVVSQSTVFVLKLEPHPMLNEEIRWVEDDLPVACGVFRVGTETTYNDISWFSHPVDCDWSAKKSFYRIFPKKGEIWAMYKNWKMTLNNSDIDKCEPRMVEILSDYSDENGVNACSLTRVKGCLSIFQRALLEDFHLTRWISRSEMLSFSHRVPAFVVVDIKERDIPQGSWHLEPSALPLRTIH